ncbi:MAG: hypothetical protein K2Y37_08880 [Pirellulales bacterium]|nr:hypothetical protein [Pirellulales bacterium]
MKSSRPQSLCGAGRCRPAALVLVAIIALVGVSGCGGCRRAENPDAAQQAKSEAEREAERKRLEAERAKPDFELGSSASLPADPNRMQLFAKPGHWTAAQSQLVANHHDFRGRFRTGALDLGAAARFRLEVTREVALAKGQKKRIEFSFYLPAGQETKQVPLALTTDSGRDVLAARDPATRLFAHQYYFTVLAREPDTFQFVRQLDTLQAPSGKYFSFNEPVDPHYRLTIVEPGSSAALPSRAAAWTSVAALVWDDFDPKPLSPEQQRALVDWLHWGGELIVSGPQTIDLLKQSFLADYLPADGAGAVELGAEQLGELDRDYSPATAALRLPAAWTGERLTPRSGARVVLGSDELPLVVERAVGSGRVVVTAFRLNERALARWPGFDSFLNCCLLRRPSRKFSRAGNSVALAWRDEHSWFDPRRVSRVRYFSRDAGEWRPWNQFGTAEAPREDPNSTRQLFYANQVVPGAAPAAEDQPFAPPGFGPGVAGWSDFGDVSRVAAGQLQEAAGIKIPSAEFVVRVLGVYLLVLVPLNFALFRLLGRVEWAWLAVPVIALGGALAVVYLAQLDIGFVRAQNELAIVELQGAYPRAHVTRYTALYTSLTTRYAAEFDDPGGVALPLAAADEALLPGQSRSTIALATDQTARLSDFRVASNSIGMLHSEHVLPLAGGLMLEPARANAPDAWQVRNATGLALRDVRVVHRHIGRGGDRYGAGDMPRDGRAEVATVGNLAPGEVRELTFSAMPRVSVALKQAVAPPVNGADQSSGKTDPHARAGAAAAPIARPDHAALVELAIDDCLNGEYRLVAWCDAPLGGMTIEPRATQLQQSSLVVAHLQYDSTATALARDSSSRREVELEIGRLPDDPNVFDYGEPKPAAEAAPPPNP